jgi:predicted acyl esterase
VVIVRAAMIALRVAAAATLCLTSLQAPVAAVQKQSRPGVYEGYSQERFDEWVRTSEYVAMRDGVRLAVDVFRPARQGQAVDEKFPVVWAHTPYRRSHRDAKGDVVSAATGLHLLPLIRHGYVVAIVDTRGRGASFGARRGFQDRT